MRGWAAGTAPEVVRGPLVQSDLGISGQLRAHRARVEVLPVFRAQRGHVACRATIRGLTGTDRCIVLSFHVPVTLASGTWRWDDDLHASRTISRDAGQPGTLVVAGNDWAAVHTPPLSPEQRYILIGSGYTPLAKGFGRTPAWWADAQWADHYAGEGCLTGERLYREEQPYGRAYLTVMAQGNVRDARVSAALDPAVIRLDAGQSLLAQELVSGRNVLLRSHDGTWSVETTLRANERTCVIRVATPQALQLLASRQAADHLTNAEAHLRWATHRAGAAERSNVTRALAELEHLAARHRRQPTPGRGGTPTPGPR